MKNQDDQEAALYTIAAAWLRSRGLRQEEISSQLAITQPEVSRLLKRAQEENWLEVLPPKFRCPKSARPLWELAQTRFFACPKVYGKLRASQIKGESVLQRVTLVQSTPDETFSSSIIDVVTERLSGVSMAGVTWGRTMSGLVSMLRDHASLVPRPNRPIQFVPMCGEPLKDRVDPLKYSSSALAAQLNDIVNGPKHKAVPPSLAGVPAFIPMGFNDEEVETIRRFVRQVAGYAAVFGEAEENGTALRSTPSMVDQVDVIFTSVGVVHADQRGIFLRERIQLGDLTEDEVRRWVVGDISGVIIPRAKVPAALAARIERMNDRSLGIRSHHLLNCAENAAKTGKPGVVVLALGPSRCEMVQRCVQLGYISELIIDQALAETLSKQLK